MSEPRRLRALLVDPSLFTAPYDAALTEGLLDAGVEPTWAARPLRPGDRHEIPAEYVDAFFYRRSDGLPQRGLLRSLVKGCAHVLGLAELVGRAAARAPDVVHFQWLVVPLFDCAAIGWLRRSRPVILTVHDTVPFNGERLSAWQRLGFDLPLKLADRVIVHTRSGRDALLRRGVPDHKIAVIPHGALRVSAAARKPAQRADASRRTIVLFGELKHYKGVDLLVEAAGRLPASARARTRIVIAGRPLMDLQPIEARIAELGLGDVVELRPRRLSNEEVAELLDEAHCFVFPYRQVDASGVYFLVKGLKKWIIASDVGVFSEEIDPGVNGRLVPIADVDALAKALEHAIEERPEPGPVRSDTSWSNIGVRTSELYRDALRMRGAA